MLSSFVEDADTHPTTGGIMRRFLDPIAEEVYKTGFSAGLPKATARKAHTRIRLLVAARTLQDVGVMGPIGRSDSDQNLYGIEVDGKWLLGFRWEDLVGAHDITLYRGKPQKKG